MRSPIIYRLPPVRDGCHGATGGCCYAAAALTLWPESRDEISESSNNVVRTDIIIPSKSNTFMEVSS
jgi:hypothetical protein